MIKVLGMRHFDMLQREGILLLLLLLLLMMNYLVMYLLLLLHLLLLDELLMDSKVFVRGVMHQLVEVLLLPLFLGTLYLVHHLCLIVWFK